jgi:hypothetical protein
VIANTPDKLPLRTALALTGGAYHEAFHTKYSCRRTLRANEIVELVLSRWAKVKDWSKYHGALQQWSNIIEDIRIERRGREDFAGVHVKLCDLQDFILMQEQAGVLDVRAHGGKPGTLSVILGVFRDVGLGYNTETQRFVMTQYEKDNPEAVKMVLAGPLSPMLRDSIGMTKDNDLGCLQVAMDVIAKLAELGQDADENERAKQGQTGDGNQECPACGASADKIKVRSKPDGQGGKVKGVGLATCTVCGFQEEVKVEPKQSGQGSGQDSPDFDGFDDMVFDNPAAGSDSDSKDQSGDDKTGGSGGKTEDKEDDGKAEADGDKDGDEKDGDEKDGDEKDGTDSGSGDGGGNSDNNGDKQGGKDGDSSGEPKDGGNQQGDETEGGSDKGGDPGSAGGHHHDKEEHPGNDWADVAQDALDQAASGKDLGLKDGNSALEDAFDTVRERDETNVKSGESPWNPYDPDLDEAELVRPSIKGKGYDTDAADQIIKSVKRETAYLRARLRTVIKSAEMTHTVHGVPRGRGLSSRFLVDSKAALNAREIPTRAYFQPDIQVDMSMAVAVVLDESGSMYSLREDATRIMTALTEPFDGLNFPTMVLGFRDGGGSSDSKMGPDDKGVYHRQHGVHYDIFKMFHERFKAIRYRFANTRSAGGTPMSDGIQYALDALNYRDEAHRFLFVVSDGCPNYGHVPVITRQIRLAKEAGIHIVGVGMGYGAQYVKDLFPDHVYTTKMATFPHLLLAKLNDLADVRASKRGRRIRKTG